MYPLLDKFRFVQRVPKSYSEIFLHVNPLPSKLQFNSGISNLGLLPIFPFVTAFPVEYSVGYCGEFYKVYIYIYIQLLIQQGIYSAYRGYSTSITVFGKKVR